MSAQALCLFHSVLALVLSSIACSECDKQVRLLVSLASWQVSVESKERAARILRSRDFKMQFVMLEDDLAAIPLSGCETAQRGKLASLTSVVLSFVKFKRKKTPAYSND